MRCSVQGKLELKYNILMLQFERFFRAKCTEQEVKHPDEYVTIGINSFRR